jgi:RNA polymerase sigma factor (sigma-70 family)
VERTDHQLLLAFSVHAEQPAFAALVERHGPMVLRVCRRVLRQEQDVEDAFQATFLVLAARASTIRKTEALASWLHGVAHRVALRARRDASRRRMHEREGRTMSGRVGQREQDWSEILAALDEEVQALPERWRAPFVLCFLEGRSRAEAARELGLKEGTIWSRLSRARKLLHEKLVRRGITLPALLTAAALSEEVARAVPGRLADSTVQAAVAAGVVPARAAVLADGVIKVMSRIQKKSLVLCLATAALVAIVSGAAVIGIASARPPVVEGHREKAPPPPRSTQEARFQDAIQETTEKVTVTGRVVGPDGKPVPFAKVTLWCHFGYHGHYRGWHPNTTGPFQPEPLATSEEDGRFTVTFRKTDVKDNPLSMWDRPWRMVQVVASAKGYGPAWASLDRPDKGEFTLRLVKDDVPVKGRVLNLEGRPVADAAIRVVYLTAGNEVHGSLWQSSWAGLADVRTGKDGRFLFSGLGRGRSALLSIKGPDIEHKLIKVRTPAVDAPAVAEPDVVVVAGPTKPVEGTVRLKGTRKPFAGVVVYGEEETHQRRVRAISDAKGRYRLTGLPKAKRYALTFYPPIDSGCLGTFTEVVDTEGLGPVTADVEIRRGIEVRCRFIDKKTRKVVQGELHYTPLESNPLYRETEDALGVVPNFVFRRIHVPDPDGVIRLVAYPGLGLLVGNLQGNSRRYLPRGVDPADAARTRGSIHMEFARLTGVYRLIEPKEGGKPLAIDIELDPGRKSSGTLIGPDGKPVTGARGFGLNDSPGRWIMTAGEELRSNSFTATLLDPQEPRTIFFVHKDRKLIGHKDPAPAPG